MPDEQIGRTEVERKVTLPVARAREEVAQVIPRLGDMPRPCRNILKQKAGPTCY
jgi:hypothetical protein